jgi:hypothetical protein
MTGIVPVFGLGIIGNGPVIGCWTDGCGAMAGTVGGRALGADCIGMGADCIGIDAGGIGMGAGCIGMGANAPE